MDTDPSQDQPTNPPASPPTSDTAADIGTADLVGDGGLKDQVIEALRTVFDPEIPVNIHALGLIYGVLIGEDGRCKITMTLTSPHCPAAESLPGEVEVKARAVAGVTGVEVSLVWDPPYTMDRLSEEARLMLGY